MDNYQNPYGTGEPEYTPPLRVPPVKSPYANSDYVTPFEGQRYEAPTPNKPQKQKKERRETGRTVLSVILILALVLGCCAATGWLVDRRWQERSQLDNQALENKLNVLQQQIDELQTPTVPNANPDISVSVPAGMMTPGQVYAQNVKAVVAISNQATTTNIYGQVSETASSGSGFIISADGYVVSNYHVVEGATALHVLTSDGTEYKAELIGYDASNDVSLLKIDGENLPYVHIGSSDALVVGDQVAAIGNPLGELTSTMTVGYVSAKDRMVTTEGVTINMLQTDAAINSGNSGGPLFNMYGQVVGITTAKYSGTSNSGASIEGIGFAIPMDDVIGIIEDLREFGYVTGAYLGVMVKNVDEAAQAYGLPAGAYVEEAVAGWAAAKAGIRNQDIIVNLGGYDVRSVTDLTRALRRFEAGQTTVVTVYRAGQNINLTITLDERPVETPTQQPQQDQQPQQPQQPQWPQSGSDGNYDYFNPFDFFFPFFG